MSDESRWLDPTEMVAWRSLIAVSTRLFEQLDRELMAEHNLSLGDYEVLAFLSEAPDNRLRMNQLADVLMVSRSRLTHHVNRLERAGLVTRAECPTDRRGYFAVLTAKGRRRLAEAAPTHVRGVREHLLDLLSGDQVGGLAKALSTVADGLSAPTPQLALD